MKRFASLSLALIACVTAVVTIVGGCSSGKSPTPISRSSATQPAKADAELLTAKGPVAIGNNSEAATQLPENKESIESQQRLYRERFDRSSLPSGEVAEAKLEPTQIQQQGVVGGITINGGTNTFAGVNNVPGGWIDESLQQARQSQQQGQQQQQGGNVAGGRGRGGGGRAGGGGGGGGGGAGFGGRRGGGRGPGPVVVTQRIILPLMNEELWVIARAPAVAPPRDMNFPRSGALLAKLPGKIEQVPVPLKHTDVKATIDGYIAAVGVQQQYHNPFSEKIEAVYVFPLPQNSAINEFVMTIGERKIRGIIRDRQEAEQIYAQARAQGYVASLLTQERPNIFTQSVANIEPGKEIDIDIKYFHTLEYVDGWYEWVFPMVVGPRFNPSYSGDGVGAKSISAPMGSTGQSAEVSYLNPDQRSGADISLSVNVNAGVKIEQVESVNHRVKTGNPELGTARIELDRGDSIPNKDFVLRYRVAGETLKTAVVVQRDPKGQGGYFTLMFVPPKTMEKLARQPLEMVFTLDVSGSMSGQPIEQSRAAIRYALNHMNPNDTFQVIRFANNTEMMTPQPVPATPENIKAALEYVGQMVAGGGTMMLDGIKTSLASGHDEERSRIVAFLTDGFIGNEADILREVHNSLAGSRIFSFGVGSSPNRYLMDQMAKMGAGAAAYLSLNDSADEIMSAYFDRVSHPALTDIALDYGTMGVSDVYPQRIPDLFVGRPVIITGRFTGKGDATIKVKGRLAGKVQEFSIPVKLDAPENQHSGIASVWARMKIAAMADQSTWDPSKDWADGIKQAALQYNLMSQFTAFVAVDSSARTAGDHGTTIAVPVPVPQGVRYDTTVQER